MDFSTIGKQFAQSIGGKLIQTIGDKFLVELPNGKTILAVPQEAIDELGNRFCVKQVTDLIIQPKDWQPVLGKAPEKCNYKYDIMIPECREDMMPDIMVTKDCTSLVNTVCESFNGYVTIYAETIPLSDVLIPRIDLWKESENILIPSANSFSSPVLNTKQEKKLIL